MVLINSRLQTRDYIIPDYEKLVFKYALEVRNSNCIFFSAREESTGRTRLFLAFNGYGRIYTRNGIKNKWVEITDYEEYRTLHKILAHAIKSKEVPCFATNQLSLQNVG